MPNIKSGNITPNSAKTNSELLEEITTLGLNTVNVPVLINIPDSTSASMSIDSTSKSNAISIIQELNNNNIKVILEAYPWIEGGTISETEYNPTDVNTFFWNWKTIILNELITDICDIYTVEYLNVASNFELLEDNTGYWTDVFSYVKVDMSYSGQTIYRTNWWRTAVWDTGAGSTTEAYNNKLSNGLFGDSNLDIISISAYFELTDSDFPSIAEIETNLFKTTYFSRNQNVFQEVKNFYDTHGKQIFFGELGFPSVAQCAKEPWNPTVTSTNDEVVQRYCFEGYKNVFSKESWFEGFSIFCIGDDTSNYSVSGKNAESLIQDWYNPTPNRTTIPYERKVETQLSIARTDGSTWYDISEHLDSADVELGDVSSVGTGDSGGDSVVRRCNFSIRNDRIFEEVYNTEIGRDSTTVLGDENTVIGDETDGAETFLEFLFDTTTTLKGNTFQPRDKVSSINQFNGIYSPLLWPTREVVLRIAIQEDSNGIDGAYNQEIGTTQIIREPVGIGDGTETTYTTNEYPIFVGSETVYLDDVETSNYSINYDTGEISTNAVGKISATYTHYETLFGGYMGDNISSSGSLIDCSCRDYAKRLQDTYIDYSMEYGSEAGTDAEVVIQQILDNNGLTDIDFYCPNSPGFAITPYKVEYVTVFDATQAIADQFGWYLGFKWDRYLQKYRYTLTEPPRSKNKYSKDYTLTARNDLLAMDLDINDRDIRNSVKVSYIDSATGEKKSVTVEDTDSINEYWRKPMQIELDNTSLINTEAEALIFGLSALSDLNDLTGTSQINIPIFPQLDLYSGVNFDNPLVSSTVDFFGIESIRHRIQVKKNNSKFRTEATCSGKVVGAHTKWLDMQTRPGAGKPINEDEIPGLDLPAVTNITLDDSGIEKKALTSTAYAVLSWTKPTGYYPQYYITQVQKAGGSWTDIQEFISRESRVKLVLSVGQDYEARIAGLTKTSKPGTWSSTFSIDGITSDVSPDPPTITSIIPMVRGLIVNLAENIEDDWDGFEIHVSETSGFTPDSSTLKDKGRKQRFEITDLSPGVRYYVKAIAYDTSKNKSVASTQKDDVAGSETTSSTLTIAASNSSARGKAGADFVCDGVSDQIKIEDAVNGLFNGGKIVLLEGTYYVDGGISLKSNITLEGQGDNTKILTSNNHDGSLIGSYKNPNFKNAQVRNLLLDGLGIARFGVFWQSGVYGSTSEIENVTIENLTVNNFTYAGITTSGDYTIDGLISNCKINNCNIGIYLFTDNYIITSCKLKNNITGINVSGNNNIVSGNMISFCEKNGIEIYSDLNGGMNNKIKGNILTENNTSLTYGGSGIYLNSGSNNVVEDNKVKNGNTGGQKWGIEISGNDNYDCIVINNDFIESATDAGIKDTGTNTKFGPGNFVNDGSWIVGADS